MQLQFMLDRGVVNMVAIKFLVALAAVYDGVLYVLQPPNCISADFGYKPGNVTWRKMNVGSLVDVAVFKIPVLNFTDDGALTFKIKLHYTSYAADTDWQTLLVNNNVTKRLIAHADDSCCASSVILSVTLLLIAVVLALYFFQAWFYYDRFLTSTYSTQPR